MTRGEALKRDQALHQENPADGPIHLPSNTYMPLLLAFALVVSAYGIAYLTDEALRFTLAIPLIAVGVVLSFIAFFRWIQVSHIDTPHGH